MSLEILAKSTKWGGKLVKAGTEIEVNATEKKDLIKQGLLVVDSGEIALSENEVLKKQIADLKKQIADSKEEPKNLLDGKK